jgi:hypothetical protein
MNQLIGQSSQIRARPAIKSHLGKGKAAASNPTLNRKTLMLKKLGLALALMALVTVARAQQNLGEMVSSAGLEWLAGDWQAETDSGNTLAVSFKMDLDKHLCFVHQKDQRSESKGMVYLDPATSEVKFCSVNNLGGLGTGVWSVEDAKAVLKYKHTGADGRTGRIGLTFAKVNADSMEVKIFELSENNELGTEARTTVKFNRKK